MHKIFTFYSKVKSLFFRTLSIDLSEVRTLTQNGQLNEATNICNTLLRMHPYDLELLAHSGYLAQQQGDFHSAIAHCKKAISINPNQWQTQFTIGLGLYKLNQFSEATKHLQKAYELAPDNEETITLLMDSTHKAFGIEKLTHTYSQMKSINLTQAIQLKYVKNLFEEGLIEKTRDEITNNHLPLIICPLVSVEQWAKKNNLHFSVINQAEKIYIEQPPVYNQESKQKVETVLTCGNLPYVSELHDVTIFSNSSVLLTKDNHVINDTATHPSYGQYVSFEYDKIIIARKDNFVLLQIPNETVQKENACYLNGLASNAYGHWIPEFLPKIAFLENHEEFNNFPLLTDMNMPESHFSMLQKVTSSPILKMPPGSAWTFKRLLVSPSPTFYPVELINNHKIPQHDIAPLSPSAMTFLRNRILPKVKSDTIFFGKKIYLSRKNMKWRRLANDTEISLFLKDHGFEILNIEEYTNDQQVLAFKNAECIVAPNGSSILNIIFSSPQIKLLVLSQPKLFNWSGYYGPMKALGYNMIFITGNEIINNKHADYSVPIEKIKNALSTIGAINDPTLPNEKSP